MNHVKIGCPVYELPGVAMTPVEQRVFVRNVMLKLCPT
jgi:hypothetical protein